MSAVVPEKISKCVVVLENNVDQLLHEQSQLQNNVKENRPIELKQDKQQNDEFAEGNLDDISKSSALEEDETKDSTFEQCNAENNDDIVKGTINS